MKPASWNKRFLVSTRGRILSLLRRSSRTVNELAVHLGLTDNAVRAHLATLERDGLVQQSGTRPSTRKPNITYALTPEAGQVFPKAYGPLLLHFLDVLRQRLPAEEMEEVLQAVAERVAVQYGLANPAEPLAERLRHAQAVFEEFGGLAEVEEHEGRLSLRGCDCPLAAAVTTHPEVCGLIQALLSRVLGAPLKGQCRLGPVPQCYFEIACDGASQQET